MVQNLSIFLHYLVLHCFIVVILCNFGEYMDLSWSFDDKTVYWPGVQELTYTKAFEGYRNDGAW